MCRYMFGRYRTHYGCAPCRYTDKRESGLMPDCPRCGDLMVDLGRDFHAPRRRNVGQWRKVELLVARNVRFDSCGCTGPGARPRTLADAKTEFGLRRRKNYAGARR